MPSYSIIIIPIVAAAVAQFLLKKGVLSLGLGSSDFSLVNLFSLIPRILQNGYLVIGIILFGISFLTYLFVLSRFQLSIVYPIFVSSGIIIIFLVSWLFLKESLSWFQILGIVLIIFGIFLLTAKIK